ncbi:MAG: L-2-amino-thiazoline-4-carboxylic acid hydrolase [Acidobacteriota bacterium]|nr:L-2-amino-thiazoline-4-carboxylic acid hydrolase [Acidobacteriota bacterium]
MSDKIDKIPLEQRWALATNGLTGAYIAISKALKDAVGKEKFEEFNGALWYEAGKGAKEFAETFGMATDTPADIEAVSHLLAKASMGPEFEFEVVEATDDRCVGRTTQCPWHKRWQEQGVDFDTCGVGHQRWGDGAADSLGSDFTFKLTKNMVRGDSHCEWVIERKK